MRKFISRPFYPQQAMGLKEYILEVIEQTGAPFEHPAREFHLEEKDLKELAR